MRENVIYHQICPFFPFVDGVWKQNDELFAFQATTSNKHPKSLANFSAFLNKVELTLQSSPPINIIYVLMPRTCENLFQTVDVLTPSFFWSNAKSDKEEIDTVDKAVKFWITCPPHDFCRSVDTEVNLTEQ